MDVTNNPDVPTPPVGLTDDGAKKNPFDDGKAGKETTTFEESSEEASDDADHDHDGDDPEAPLPEGRDTTSKTAFVFTGDMTVSE